MEINNERALQFFQQQVAEWDVAKKNYTDLDNVQTKQFNFEGFDVSVQFNPARIASAGAKMDAESIAKRKCFLCEKNRPVEQGWIDQLDYQFLVNPFPILPVHFTIAHKTHTVQEIRPYFDDYLYFVKHLSDFIVFYNSPNCGASAPDHLHFQAGTRDYLPIFGDYKKLKKQHAELIKKADSAELYLLHNYLRNVYCIESKSEADAKQLFFEHLDATTDKINMIGCFENDSYYIFVFPRKESRPWQFFAEGDDYLLVSPGTVEMSGMLITPIKEHFDKITKEDVVSIYQQVSL